jgi:hypothetical protein
LWHGLRAHLCIHGKRPGPQVHAYADIDKDVVVMGMIDAIGIWAKDRFDQRQETVLSALDSINLLDPTSGSS